jgi:hypothetical protein
MKATLYLKSISIKVNNIIKTSFFIISIFIIGASWPLEEKYGLTSSFCEWREGHLHAGIDLPTGSEIGKRVRSVSDGWVMRVRTSPFGYGKALYIRDLEGNIFVYAHLSTFSSDIRRKVRTEQLKRFSYEVDKWFKKGKIPIKNGELLGFSGRSGCYSPHLHFEMRDSDGNPVDPIIRGFSVPDEIPPDILAIRLVPLDDTSTICGSHLPSIIHPMLDTPFVWINGQVGLEIETYDKVDGHSGLLAPKEIELYKDKTLLRKEYFDKFSYSHDSDSRFEFDFENRVRTGKKFRRLFTVLGNNLPFYKGGDAIFNKEDKGLITIIVRDARLNESKAYLILGHMNDKKSCRIKRDYEDFLNFTTFTNGVLLKKDNSLHWIESNKIGFIAKGGDSIQVWNIKDNINTSLKSPDSRCNIYLNEDAILNTSLISVRVSKGDPTLWIWEPPVPIDGKITLEIDVESNQESYSIYELVRAKWEFYRTKINDSKLNTKINHLGTFAVLQDTIPPIILFKNRRLKQNLPILVHVSDSLSGIDFYSIKTFINKEQTVFRYDPQFDRLIHEFPEEIPPGNHTLSIFIKDRQGNGNFGKWEFFKMD